MEQQTPQTPPTYTPPPPGNEQDDIQRNKTMAMIAYVIFFIPLLTDAKNSPFARYHANQGLILLICSVILSIILSIISSMLVFSLSLGLIGFIGLLSTIIWIATIVLVIIGIMNANNGKMVPLPVIGKLFTIIK
jgi:uncharacterized membrane protein